MTADGPPVGPIAERYEALREGALRAAQGGESASGLALFLRRGVWAWARLAAAHGRQKSEPGTNPLSSSVPHAERADFARILAGMALAHPLNQGTTA